MAGSIITDKGMKALPGKQDVYVIEDGKRGAGRFVGRITPAGARLFYFRYTNTAGKREWLLIGSYDARGDGVQTFTVLQARNRATEHATLYAEGRHDLKDHLEQRRLDRLQDEKDTREAGDTARAAQAALVTAAAAEAARRITLRRLFAQWQLAELKPQKLADGTRTGRKDGGQWVLESFERRLFPTLGDLAAEDVRKAELLQILDGCKAGGHRRTANVLLADLKQMFRFAAEREIVLRNPLNGIRRASIGGKDVERLRALDDGELQHLSTQVSQANLGSRSVAAIWLILGTACRIGELMGARWEHVNMQARTWYLPETKNERDHLIHLSDFSVQQFQRLAKLRQKDAAGDEVPWVFPNSRGTGPVCAKSFGKQLADRQRDPSRRMLNRAKNTRSLMLKGGRWTAHDLRRTAATLMAKLEISTDVIDECLNHKLQSKVSRVYIRDRRQNEQAKAFDALGARLAQLMGQLHVMDTA